MWPALGYLEAHRPPVKETVVGIALLILLLALVAGGIGLFVEALQWLLIIALVLLLVGAFAGWQGRSRA